MFSIILLCLGVSTLQTAIFHRHLHDISTGARCLDGSPAALYVYQGQSTNILIYINGGAYCSGNTVSQAIEACYQRSMTDLGSSKNYPDVLDHTNSGILSNVQAVNPHFWNWTKANIMYCDGSVHHGSRLEPIVFRDALLYLRGMNNTMQHFKYLNDTYDLFKADKIVLTGESAGGVATFAYSNYIYENSESKNVYAIPDSGLFLNSYVDPKSGKQTLKDTSDPIYSLVYKETPVPVANCVEELHDNFWCMQFSVNPKYLKAPLFVIQAEYDRYCLNYIISANCTTPPGKDGSSSISGCSHIDREDIEDYRKATMKGFDNFTKALQKVGFWAPACVQHGFLKNSISFSGDSYRVPGVTGVTLSDAIGRFMANVSDKSGNRHVDKVIWPDNRGCSSNDNTLPQETLFLQ